MLNYIPSPPRGVWDIGPIPLRAYAAFIILGIVVAVVWGGRRYVARGGAPGRIADLAVFAVPFGLVGGRIYHVLTDRELYFGPGRNPWKAFAIWDGGLGIWGAIMLGAVGIWIGCRYYKIPMAPVADAVAPGIVVAQAIGRLGNYFNQELFGGPTTVPWALEVFARTPDGAPAPANWCAQFGGPNDAPEFPTTWVKADPTVLCGTYQPTFLYELLWNLAVAALIVWADRRFRMGGARVFALYVAGYTAGRAWIEAMRIDPARTQVFGLRVNIVVSIVIFVLAVIFLIWRRNVGREDPAVVAGPAAAAEPGAGGPDADHPDAGADAGGADADRKDAGAADAGSPDPDRPDTQHRDPEHPTAGAATGPAADGSAPDTPAAGDTTPDPPSTPRS
ncbi:prolipoprotein diacylglyceryl transferase [Nakamurella aerolata]|uniref:Phosphatidylglycerol--prolipoprotein diacylglyceryl transferase n=1 Tax=Nakamurella aerolata TaxID=1656892 RepID=A0A849A1N8_9ACTN|nr:prolipoprotein diacylglyceryl transferase [Nakamurella aerolata]NNG34539.1 prolipoprotein diacylglyceryl transferase [Nakamurella aerolata]